MQKVVITTAKALSEAVLKTITLRLAKQYGKDLEYKMVINPKVLGGVKISVGTQEIDATVAHKLVVLRAELSQD